MLKRQFYYSVILAAFLASCNFPVTVNIKTLSTATLTATATPPPTPTVTPSPSPSPTPTPPPAVRIHTGEEALFLGDYKRARLEFQASLEGAADPKLKAAAMLGIGRAFYAEGNLLDASKTLQAMIAAYPRDDQAAAAYFTLAKVYEAQQLPLDAVSAYRQYLERRPGALDDFVNEQIGDALASSGDYAQAADAYQAALDSSADAGGSIWVRLKLGESLAVTGDFAGAIEQYQAAFEQSSSDYVKARANYLIGSAYLATGRPQQAYDHFNDSVINYPGYNDSYQGLVEMINAGVIVDEYQRGLVDYYAGKYGLAVDAFTRSLENPETPAAAALFYRAMSYSGMDEDGNAIADLDLVLEGFDTGMYPAKAADEKAYLLWATFRNYSDAAQVLLDYVKQHPEAPEVGDFLFQAGRIYERGGLLEDAAATWQRMITESPAAENSYRGLFLAGISLYRLEKYQEAQTVFQRCLVLATGSEEQAAAYLWTGKTQQALGFKEDAKNTWEKGAAIDPTGYYSIRASELIGGGQPFQINQPIDYGYDLAAERREADAWLKETFQIPPEKDLTGPGELASDSRYRRGTAFWDLGLYNEARDEFESLRVDVAGDAEQTYRLMNTLHELGIFRSAVLASRQVLDLAGFDDAGTLKAPAYFNHIRYGIYYKDQVFEAAKQEKLSPLLLLSIMRQESLFEGFASSGAGARGLMQIMPGTGTEIAGMMDWPDGFTSDDLYRPVISIPMGARYFARQQEYFDGSVYAALSAYNGGPGNTMAWSELAGGDPDLLLEVIRASETRTYIIHIYEIFNFYRLIYSRGI